MMAEEYDAQGLSVREITHDRISMTEPEYLARGGSRVVYEIKIPEDIRNRFNIPDNNVAKVNVPITLAHLNARQDPNFNEKYFNKYLVEHSKRENERLKLLSNYFPGRTLKQSIHQLRVPINQRLVENLHARYQYGEDLGTILDDLPTEVSTLVEVQEKLPEDRDYYDFTSAYPELRGIAGSEVIKKNYERVTNATVLGKDSDFSREDFTNVYTSIKPVLEIAERDTELKDLIREFTRNCIRYTDETKEMIDLVGKNNVVFFKNDQGKWDYKLIDVVLAEDNYREGTVEDLNQNFARFIKTKNLSRRFTGEEYHSVINKLNYVRFVNGLAKLMDVDDQIGGLNPNLTSKVDATDLSEAIRRENKRSNS